MTRVTACRAFVLLLVFLGGCAGDPWADYTPLPEAVQHPHRQAVPHTDRNGARLAAYDPARSFLPLALGGALADYDQPGRGFHAAFLADFNAVVADSSQPLDAMLTAAEGSRVQVLRPQRDLPHAALLDASAAAVIAMPRDPAESDAFASSAHLQSARPVWALLPVNARPHERLLEPAEARALLFAAITAGASGIIWQGEDNYAARNAGAMGISAQPQLDYGIRTQDAAPLAVTPEATAASRRLWIAVAQMNRRIARIAPALLQPDAAVDYTLAASTARPDRSVPPRLRSLLKPFGDDWLLIVVNPAPLPEDIRVALRFSKAVRLDDERPLEQDAARGQFRDRIEAYGAQLYRITP